jgi:putative transposase
MRKTFKYRIYANKETLANAENCLELCRRLYNCALAERIYAYKMKGVTLSCFDQIKELTQMKKENSEYCLINLSVLQEVIERVNRAYISFFNRIKKGNGKFGFPRFKSKNRYNSFTLKQTGWKVNGKYLSISKVGTFKLILSRQIGGDIKTVTISRSSMNKWFACFNCDNVPETKLPKSSDIIGIDVGIKSFLVDSDGNKVDNPTYYRKSERLLRRRQRVLCRRKKGSINRRKARILVAKAHEKVTNQRYDFLHKLSTSYIRGYGTLVFEDLNIQGMVKNSHLAKSISDCGWGLFYRLCEYKAEEAGRRIIRIPRSEPTSKTCSECGAINQELKLSDRNWLCKSCGTYHDRDFNAAKNIKRVGQTQQELTYGNSQSVSCESTHCGMSKTVMI